MASSRLAAFFGSPVVAALVAASGSFGCAQSDAVEQPALDSAAAAGGGDSPGSGGSADGPGSAAETSGADTSPATSTAETSTGSGEGGEAPGSGGAGPTSSSGGATCGNGGIEAGEACDGDDLGATTCVTEGFDGGTLACDACQLDTSGCTSTPLCANGLDDDDDGLIDAVDPGCTGAADDDELVYSPTCDGAGTAVVDLTTASGMSIDYVGTTDDPGVIVNNFTSTIGGGCPSAPGPEVALRFVVSSVIGTLVVSLDNPGTAAGWDPVLYVRSATCTGAQVGCNDDGPSGAASELILSNMQPGTYYIFVDGRSAADVGAFEISLTPS